MTERSTRGFAARPGDAESWIKAPDAPIARTRGASAFTARLTIDVTPALRGRIKVAAFRRGVTVADMLRDLLAREFPADPGEFMNDNEPSPPRVVPPTHRRNAALTQVELTWIEKKIEHWLRFGRRADEKILDRRRSVSSFKPGSIFAFVRWASNDFGTVVSRMDIVRAVEAGARYQTLPFVRPGGEILLRVDSWPKVERVLQAIDAVEALDIDPTDVAPEYWRHLHNRLAAGHEPRVYTREQHQAWLKRRSVIL